MSVAIWMENEMPYQHEINNMDVSRAYQLGKKAHQSGQPMLESNPFKAPSVFADAFDRGYLDDVDLYIAINMGKKDEKEI
jgi:hypothetical protein